MEEYPAQAPIWFSEDESAIVTTAMSHLSEENTPSNILHQIHQLTTELCSAFGLDVPPSLEAFALEEKGEEKEEAAAENNDEELDNDDDSEMEDDVDDDFEMEEKPQAVVEEDCPQAKEVIGKVKQFQRKQHLAGKTQGSITASDRLMKEIRDIFKSDHHKEGVYTFKLLNDDNLYEWHVKLFKVDPDSSLASDIRRLAKEQNQDHILFHFVFNTNYPFEPPFVRLISPAIEGGFVTRAGAICLELLTKQGWSSAYSIDSLVLQISASLASAKAKILFDQKPTYTMEGAIISFKNLVQVHSARGWHTPGKNEG